MLVQIYFLEITTSLSKNVEEGANLMLRLLWACAAVMALCGCMETTSSNTFNGPSGTPVSSAKCMYSPNGCLKQASDACAGGPYQVLDSDSHSGGLVADIMPGPVTWYNLSYRCGPSDGRMPAFAFRGQQWVDTPDTTIVVAPSSTAPTGPITCQSRRIGGMVQTSC